MSTRFREIVLVSSAVLGGILLWRYSRKKAHVVAPLSALDIVPIVPSRLASRFRVFFGSQTGTSESFANELAAEALADYGIDCGPAISVEMFDFAAELGAEKSNLIFILSTYGEGDPSDDAIQFDETLRDHLGALENVSYAIFGLGNKQYAYFNEMAKRTDKRFHKLGAVRICPTGFGDDNVDIEQDWEEWKTGVFWSNFTKTNNLKKLNEGSLRNPMDKVLLETKIASKRTQLGFDASVLQGGSDLISKFFFASNIVPVVSKSGLCPGKVQLDLDITKVPSLKYRTGDTLDVLPSNRGDDIEWLIREYGLEKGDLLTFFRKKNCGKKTVKKPFPTPCSISTLVAFYLDLSGHPTRTFIRDIAILLKLDDEKLIENFKSGGSNRDFLQSLKNISNKIEFNTLIQLIPKQKSRAYSICSSPVVDLKKISLLVSKVDDLALASSWLVDSVGSTREKDSVCLLHVTLRAGVFRLPPLKNQPVIMICVGTGFAPFRAFLAELKLKNSRKAVLFFGCRTSNEWIYRDEMTEFQTNDSTEHPHHLFIATSREGKKEYVQHRVAEEMDLVRSLVAENAVIYVCGSTAMGLDIMNVFRKHIDVEDMRTKKQYIEELWG